MQGQEGEVASKGSHTHLPGLSPLVLPSPSAPWHLTGAAGVFPLLRRRRLGAQGFVRYDSSPVGAYCEFWEAHITLLGPTITRMLVTSDASRQGGRLIWGYPKEVAPLVWQDEVAGRVTFRHNRQIWRVSPLGPSFPLKLRAWTVQNLNGKRVKVPCRIAGKMRLARCGRLWGVLFTEFALDVESPQPV